MKQKILGFIASIFLRVLRLTYRYKVICVDQETEKKFFNYLKAKKPNNDTNFLLAFFHQDELALIPYFKSTGFSTLVSLSKDGEIMAQAAGYLGYHPVRGSSSRGAASGLIAAIRKVKEGYNLAFAVDGPRGPIFKVKPGLCAVSNKTQKLILPIRAHIDYQYVFEKSWNKAKFPKPFTKITLRVGKFDFYTPETLENSLLNLKP